MAVATHFTKRENTRGPMRSDEGLGSRGVLGAVQLVVSQHRCLT